MTDLTSSQKELDKQKPSGTERMVTFGSQANDTPQQMPTDSLKTALVQTSQDRSGQTQDAVQARDKSVEDSKPVQRFTRISQPIQSNILSSDAFTKYLFEKSTRDFKPNPSKNTIKKESSQDSFKKESFKKEAIKKEATKKVTIREQNEDIKEFAPANERRVSQTKPMKTLTTQYNSQEKAKAIEEEVKA